MIWSLFVHFPEAIVLVLVGAYALISLLNRSKNAQTEFLLFEKRLLEKDYEGIWFGIDAGELSINLKRKGVWVCFFRRGLWFNRQVGEGFPLITKVEKPNFVCNEQQALDILDYHPMFQRISKPAKPTKPFNPLAALH